MKFYPQDFNGDERLRVCSLAARGLWACFFDPMNKTEPKGYLLINGRRPTYAELAQVVGCKEREVKYGVEELIKNGVCSVTDDGVIFSRRMVRDGGKLTIKRSNGRLGGNPALKPEVNQQDNHKGNQNVASSFFCSSSEFSDQGFADKVHAVSELFGLVYQRVRGVPYPPRPVRDYPHFVDLARGWALERLDPMLEVFLRMPAREAHNVPGTPGQFLHMAPECDRRLRENGL